METRCAKRRLLAGLGFVILQGRGWHGVQIDGIHVFGAPASPLTSVTAHSCFGSV